MVLKRENRQKYLTSCSADMWLLRTNLTLGTAGIFVCSINNMPGFKEGAP